MATKKRNTDPIASVGEYISNPLGGTGAGIAARSASDSYHKEYPEREETTYKRIKAKTVVPQHLKGKTFGEHAAKNVQESYTDFINSFNAYTSNYKTDYDNDEDIKVASVGSAFMAGKLRDKGQKLMDYAKMYPSLFTAPEGYDNGSQYIQSLVANALDTVDRMDKSYEKMPEYVREKKVTEQNAAYASADIDALRSQLDEEKADYKKAQEIQRTLDMFKDKSYATDEYLKRDIEEQKKYLHGYDSFENFGNAISEKEKFLKNAEAYKNAVSAREAQKAEQKRMANFDYEAAKAQRDEEKSDYEEATRIENSISALQSYSSGQIPEEEVTRLIARDRERQKKYLHGYDSFDDFKSAWLSREKDMFTYDRNKVLNDAEQLKSAEDYGAVVAEAKAEAEQKNAERGSLAGFLGSTAEHIAYYRDLRNSDNFAENAEDRTAYLSLTVPDEAAEKAGFYMTAPEYNRYMYMSKTDPDKAEKYLEALTEQIETRYAVDIADALDGKTARELTTLFSFAAQQNVEDLKTGLTHMVGGAFNDDSYDYIPPSYRTISHELIDQDLGEGNEAMFGKTWGQIFGDLAWNTGNMLPSVLASSVANVVLPGSGEIIGSAMMGFSAASQSYQEAVNAGYDKDSAREYGIAIGLTETVFERVLGGVTPFSGGSGMSGIAEMLAKNVDHAWQAFFLKWGVSASGEFFEEYLEEWLEPQLKKAILNDDSDVIPFFSSEALYAGLLGFASGLIFDLPGTAQDVHSTSKLGQSVKSSASTADVVALTNDLSGNAVDSNISAVDSNSAATESTTDGKAKKKKEPTAYRLGVDLLEAGETIGTKNRTQALEQLTERGYSADKANSYIELASDYLSGDTSTVGRIADALVNDPDSTAALDVLFNPRGEIYRRSFGYSTIGNRLNTGNIDIGDAITTSQRHEAESGIKRSTETAARYKQAETDGNAYGMPNTVREQLKLGKTEKYRYSKENSGGELRTVRTDSGETAKIKDAIINNGKAELVLDNGSTVPASSVTFASKDDAILLHALTASKMDGASAAGVFMDYSGNGVISYAAGMLGGYENGMRGNTHAESYYIDSWGMNPRQYNFAYQLGETAAAHSNQQRIKEAKKTARTDPNRRSVKGKLELSRSAEKATEKMTKTERTHFDEQRTVGELMAELYPGLKVVLHASEAVEENGQTVHRDIDTHEVLENGWYDSSDGSIHLDINSGINGDGIMAFTMSHELVHYIRDISPDMFRKLTECLSEIYYMEGMSLEELARARAERDDISYDAAFEESVAHSLERMLLDSDALEYLIKMKKRESGLFNRLRGHVDESYEHVKQLRAEYEGRKPESVEGRVLGHGTETILQAYEYAKDEQEKAYKAYAEAKDSASRKERIVELSEARKVLHAAEARLEQARTYTASMTKMYKRLHKLFAKAAYMASENGEIIRSSDKAWSEMTGNTDAAPHIEYQKRYLEAEENADIISMLSKIESGNYKASDKVHFGTVSPAIAKRIEEITGIAVEGFDVAIEARQIEHILKDHGKHGLADRSMSNFTDIAKMEYAMNDPDDIRKAGKTRAYTYTRNGRNKTADTILYEKNIGAKSYYVVQAVADTKAKTLYIVTAFIGIEGYKKEAPQLTNAQSPSATSEIGSAVTSESIITQADSESQPLSEKNSQKNQQRAKSEETLRAETAETILRDKYNVNVGKLLEGMDSMLENYKGSKSRKELEANILEAAVKTNEFSSGEGSFKHMSDAIESLTDEIIASSPVLTTEIADDNAVEAQRAIKEMRFKVSDKIKADFESAKDYESFRKQHIGRLPIISSGVDVDVAYAELNSRFGESLFPSDIVNPADQLRQIAEITDLKQRTATETEISEIRNAMMSSLYRAFSDPVQSEKLSARERLVTAMESQLNTRTEYDILSRYRKRLNETAKYEQHIHELESEIAAARKEGKKTSELRDKYTELQKEKNRLAVVDSQLLRTELSEPLRNAADIARERQLKRTKARMKAKEQEKIKSIKEDMKQQLKEQRAEAREKQLATIRRKNEQIDDIKKQYAQREREKRESRNETELRHHIKRTSNELKKLLLNGSKEHHIPHELTSTVAKLLHSFDVLNASRDSRIPKVQARIEETQARLDAARAALDSASNAETAVKLREDIERYEAEIAHDRNLIEKYVEQTGRAADLAEFLGTVYKAYENDEDSFYNPEIAKLFGELKTELKDKPLRDMTLDELERLDNLFSAVKKLVSERNKVFFDGKKQTISNIAEQAISQIEENFDERSKKYWLAGESISEADWMNLKPIYGARRTRSAVITELMDSLIKGEGDYARLISEAVNYRREQCERFGYDKKWQTEKIDRTFTSSTGKSFKLTYEEAMMIYVAAKRAGFIDHLTYGGFRFEGKRGIVKGEHDVTYYKLNAALLNEISESLTENQRSFADAMQRYLAENCAEQGNAVALERYGWKIFTEKAYVPIQVVGDTVNKNEVKVGDSKLINSGITKSLKKGAKNPVVLRSFSDVWAEHVNKMALFSTIAVPLETFERVLNYNSRYDTDTDTRSLRHTLEQRCGRGALKFFDQLITDLNGGVHTGIDPTLTGKFFSRFKKGAVLGSVSVGIQQPSAIGRAFAYVDVKYFADAKHLIPKIRKEIWEEVKKYAPVAIIKEMGYFDTGIGRSVEDYINSNDYDGIGSKLKAFFTDGDYRDEKLGTFPQVMDELTWCHIWDAVKNKVRAEQNLSGEQLLQEAGRQFTEVITKTQVYDSVLSRNAFMRSNSLFAKMTTAFMSEPTTTINMLEDAATQFRHGGAAGKRFFGRVVASCITATILNSILKSFISAARDDDDDQSYLEKYIEAFVGSMTDDLIPFNYVPILRDIWSMVQGYDIERGDMTLFADLITATKNILSAEEISYRNIEDFAGAIANFCGLPVKNVMRDIRSAYQAVETILSDNKTTAYGIRQAFKENIPFIDSSPRKELYNAIKKGDPAAADEIMADITHGKDLKPSTVIRQVLREYDDRVHDAAMLRYNGDIDGYAELVKAVRDDGFDLSDVIGAVNSELNKIEKENAGETDEPSSASDSTSSDITQMYNKSDIIRAYGDAETTVRIANEMQQAYIDGGRTKAEAKLQTRTRISAAYYDIYRREYLAGNKAEARMKIYDTLRETHLYPAGGIADLLAGWNKRIMKEQRESK